NPTVNSYFRWVPGPGFWPNPDTSQVIMSEGKEEAGRALLLLLPLADVPQNTVVRLHVDAVDALERPHARRLEQRQGRVVVGDGLVGLLVLLQLDLLVGGLHRSVVGVVDLRVAQSLVVLLATLVRAD